MGKYILVRIAKLPNSYGAHSSDIAHGEATGICLGLERFSEGFPKILITDRASVREVALNIRNRESTNEGRNRNYT